MRIFFTAVVLLYLALDFGNPNMPGAACFDLDESVEVVQLQRTPTAAPPALTVTPAPLARRAPIRVSAQRVGHQTRRDLGVEPVPLHPAERPAADLPGPEED